MDELFDVPILLLIFNRPEETLEVFSRIKEIKPQKLYVASDGPRTGVPEDKKKVLETRAVIENVDWDCKVETLYREENLGCGKSVSSSITWFFENVEEGIIIEDDCLPNKSFFHYCKSALEEYRNDKTVFHIGGNNNISGKLKNNTSVYFSAYNHIWGWASWRRAWAFYNYELLDVEENISKDFLQSYFKSKGVRKSWYNLFEKLLVEPVDTWDYQWTYTVWKNMGISVLPKINLVRNIGFNENATHTQAIVADKKEYGELEFPLSYPERIQINNKADDLYSKEYVFREPSMINKVKFMFRKKLKLKKTS